MGRSDTNPRPKPESNGIVPKAQRPPATFGPDDLSTAAEVVYAGAHPQQWQSNRTASPLLTRHYGVKPEPAGAAPPASPDAPIQPPIWPRPTGPFALAASTVLLPPAARGFRRPTTPPTLREELRWIAPEPLKWVSADEMLPDPAAEAAALAALRAQKAMEEFEKARAERIEDDERKRIEAERLATERAERARLEAEGFFMATDRGKAKDGAGTPPIQTDDGAEGEDGRPRTSDAAFPPSPLNIRDFDDLLHLYAQDIGDSLEASGLLTFQEEPSLGTAQQAVSLHSGENSHLLFDESGEQTTVS